LRYLPKYFFVKDNIKASNIYSTQQISVSIIFFSALFYRISNERGKERIENTLKMLRDIKNNNK